MTYDEWDGEMDDLYKLLKSGKLTEYEFQREAESLQNVWDEEGEE